MSYIELKNINYWYPEEKNKTLDNINLNIQNGHIVFITGKSGSGKSTLAKCITGAVPNFYGGTISGAIYINGRDLKAFSHTERAKEITMVFQDPEKQLMMNKVHREVAFGLENVGIEEKKIKRRVWESLQFTNMLSLSYRDIDTLSGGEKQKIAITSAVAYMPRCIILDEPTSQLDPSASEEIAALLRKINEELGITIIVIEQRIDKWFDAADEIVVMDKGRTIFSGNKYELYSCKDQNLYDYMPNYLKLSKKLKFKDMPISFRACRNVVHELKPEIKINDSSYIEAEVKNCCISAEKLTSGYNDKNVIDNLSMKLMENDFVSILGPNGAGKSTLLKTLMGLIRYKGSVKLYDHEIKKLKLKDISKYIGYISQNPNDYLSKDTLYNELKFTLDNFDIHDDEIIEKTLEELGLLHLKDKNPRDLSGGERQRAAIASVLVLKPKIIFLDEPTRGLDYENKKRLGFFLRKLNKDGTAIVLVTHDVEFASEFCRRFILLFNGEIIADGGREDILSDSIYYTTQINKIFRGINDKVYNISQISEGMIE